jgi:Family of unknown function (DUF6111)
MIRPLLIGLALFLTAFAAYALYLWPAGARPARGSLLALQWLTIAALVLMIAGFVVWAQYDGAPPGATYVPAHMENGQLVRGTFK